MNSEKVSKEVRRNVAFYCLMDTKRKRYVNRVASSEKFLLQLSELKSETSVTKLLIETEINSIKELSGNSQIH